MYCTSYCLPPIAPVQLTRRAACWPRRLELLLFSRRRSRELRCPRSAPSSYFGRPRALRSRRPLCDTSNQHAARGDRSAHSPHTSVSDDNADDLVLRVCAGIYLRQRSAHFRAFISAGAGGRQTGEAGGAAERATVGKAETRLPSLGHTHEYVWWFLSPFYVFE